MLVELGAGEVGGDERAGAIGLVLGAEGKTLGLGDVREEKCGESVRSVNRRALIAWR